MRELPKRQYNTVSKMLDLWEKGGELDVETAKMLRDGIAPMPFDWQKAARCLLAVALCCIFVGIAALTRARWVIDLMLWLFGGKAIVKCIFFAVVAAALYLWSGKRRRHFPEKVFTNEAMLFLGVLSTAASIAWLGTALDNGSGHFSLLLGLAALVYGTIALALDSILVWIFALFSLGSWLGAETGYVSGWGAYWLGLNYPARFSLYGALLTALSQRMERYGRLAPFTRSTLSVGLLFLFVSLWIMSIFGNYGDMNSWYDVRQMELFHWSLLFAAAAGVSLWLGIKRDDAMLRGYGLTFLGINLYTRYFENFWNGMDKGLFFLILGGSLWFLGSKAEKIWNIKKYQGLPKDNGKEPDK